MNIKNSLRLATMALMTVFATSCGNTSPTRETDKEKAAAPQTEQMTEQADTVKQAPPEKHIDELPINFYNRHNLKKLDDYTMDERILLMRDYLDVCLRGEPAKSPFMKKFLIQVVETDDPDMTAKRLHWETINGNGDTNTVKVDTASVPKVDSLSAAPNTTVGTPTPMTPKSTMN